MRSLVSILLLALTLPAAAKPLDCEDSSTGETVRVKVPGVKRALKAVRVAMKKRGIHVVDLPADAQDRRRRLDEDLRAKDWCVVRSHVIVFEDAVATIEVDGSFLAGKFSRVEKWARAVSGTARKDNVDKAMANASAFIADGRYSKANQVLNRVLAILFGSGDPWAMPAAELLESAEDDGTRRPKVEIRPSDVAKGCPALAKKGKAGKEAMRATIRKLAREMDRRMIRPIDLDGGADLVADMNSYARLGAVWPATRVACAMLAMVEDAEVGLGLVQKRFLYVTKLRDQRGVSPENEQQFRVLVRTASDFMAKQEWGPAHRALEELLVLMGETATPASALP
jgi:hypothetical protein